jgi:cellulose biosynthesis protein BcsQ
MKSIVLFNNKGGVGKTTLTANVASHIAQKLNKRVCVIDGDPQCNVTQLILGDEKTVDLYWPTRRTSSKRAATLLDVVQPIMDGDANIAADIVPQKSSENRFGVDLIPGHPRLSAVEDTLSRAWTDLTAKKIGGFRITLWLRSLLKEFQSRYDYVFIDVGPSLGSINRSILVSSGSFVTPLGSDVFSLLGIRNIAQWMTGWSDEYARSYKAAMRDDREQVAKYGVPSTLDIVSGFSGYTLQQYITKSKQGKRRATVAFEKIIEKVPQEIETNLSKFIPKNLNFADLHLGDVPNLYSIIPLAQNVNSPIFALKGGDKLVGAQYQQSQSYSQLIADVSTKLVQNLG